MKQEAGFTDVADMASRLLAARLSGKPTDVVMQMDRSAIVGDCVELARELLAEARSAMQPPEVEKPSPYRVNHLADVAAFHDRFQQGYAGPIRLLTPEEAEARCNFIQEEAEELSDAFARGDLVKVLDSCIDLEYFALGTIDKCGMGGVYEKAWTFVQNANMAKEPAPISRDGSAKLPGGYQYKIVKPQGWLSPEPELAKLLGVDHGVG